MLMISYVGGGGVDQMLISYQKTRLTGIIQSCCSHVSLLNSMLNLIQFLFFLLDLYLEHKIVFKKYLIEQQLGHFFVRHPSPSVSTYARFFLPKKKTCKQLLVSWARDRVWTFPHAFLSCSAQMLLSEFSNANQLNKQGTRTEYWVELNFGRSWEGKSDRNKTSIIAKENRFILESVLFLIWLHILPVFSWRRDVD